MGMENLERFLNTDIGRIKVGQYEKIMRIGRLCPVFAELFYLYYYGSFHHIKYNNIVVN